MSIDRDDLRMILTERYGREYDITEEDLDDILALDMESGAPATVHGPSGAPSVATAHFSGGYSDTTAVDDLRARLANITELRDEMRTAGGAVVWIDDLDTILDGASPGAALTAEEAADVAQVLRGVGLPLHMQALAARLEAQQ